MLQKAKYFWAATVMAVMTLIAQPTWGQDPLGGVLINPDGVFSTKSFTEATGRLTMQRLEAARNAVNQDLQKPSKLRKVSLRRLEQQVKAMLEAGKDIPEDMQYLAGITRLTHVFYYPETQDIVIAGPAEGYFKSGGDKMIGMETGRATLHLQDLIVALRAFPPSGEKTPVISVSIDPTEEGLKRLAAAQRNLGNVNMNQRFAIANHFREALGHQLISIQGVSPKTHFAQVLVQADYNMKLIGIGLEQPAAKITSFIEAATTRSGNRLQRWFFRPKYDTVSLAEDNYAMALSGQSVELVGEDEIVSAQGKRSRTGVANKASQRFTTSFTKAYGDLAKARPLYAQMENVIDLSVAAAYIQKMGLYRESEWELETFGDESVVAVENLQTPEKVDAVVNVVVKGGAIMTPIGGGVNIQPRIALNSDAVTIDTEGTINEVKDGISFDKLQDGQWWWD